MKKIFLYFAVTMIFASCAPKASEETEVIDETAVIIEIEEVPDSIINAADSSAHLTDSTGRKD